MFLYHIKVKTPTGFRSYCNVVGLSLEDTHLAMLNRIQCVCQHSTKESAENACNFMNRKGLEAKVVEGPCDEREPYYDNWEMYSNGDDE